MSPEPTPSAAPRCEITILFDRDQASPAPALATGWGFSAWIVYHRGDGSPPQRWVFDTAWDGGQVVSNAGLLGVDLATADGLFLSHGHWDHAGGLPQVLDAARPARVAVPDTLSRHLQGEIARRLPSPPARLRDAGEDDGEDDGEDHSGLWAVSGPRALAPGLWSTGPLPPTGPPTSDGSLPAEQALVMETAAGGVVVTGCSHPGLPAVLAAARRWGPIHAVLGGFHGFSELPALAAVSRAVPAHCTQRTAEILAAYPERAQAGRAGDRFRFPATS